MSRKTFVELNYKTTNNFYKSPPDKKTEFCSDNLKSSEPPSNKEEIRPSTTILNIRKRLTIRDLDSYK